MDTYFKHQEEMRPYVEPENAGDFHKEVPSFKVTLKSIPTWSQALLT